MSKGVKPPRGYVEVFVGMDHPLAMRRGYAYKHRLVAAEVHGVDAVVGKDVHHRNHQRVDNDKPNLAPMTRAEHMALHRGPASRLRLPGEENPIVACACGCGANFLRYDRQGRPREFVNRHHPLAHASNGQFLKGAR